MDTTPAAPKPSTAPTRPPDSTRGDAGARCAAQWRASEHVAAGTAPVARFWVAVEQPGPWGAKALTQSRLAPDTGSRLDAAVSRAGGKAVLVRRPGERADVTADRTLLVATGLDEVPVIGRRSVAASDVVVAVDDLVETLDDVAAGRLPEGFVAGGPALLVCSNGKRDRCCAIEGRPLLRQLADDSPVELWESSHLNGHRFAPTALVLPTGQLGAWLDAGQARALGSSAAEGVLWSGGVRWERGLTCFAPAVQAVDVVLREQLGPTAPGSLAYEPDAELARIDATDWVGRTGTVTAQHVDGRTWRFAVTATRGDDLPASCGKAPGPSADWVVRPA